MGRCFRFIRVLSLMLLVGLGGAGARADRALDDQRGRAHYIAGESHFAAGRWSDAVREFTLAYELSQRQEMLINRSRAYERDGRLAEARDDLTLLLALHPDTPYRAEAETGLERLSRQLAAATPAPALALPDPPAQRAQQAPTSPGEPVLERRRMPGWPVLALGGGALVAAAVALGTGLRAHAIHDDLERACRDDACPTALLEDRDQGRALARASTGLTFGAVALIGGALGMYVHALRHPAPVAVDVDARAHGAAARLRVRF